MHPLKKELINYDFNNNFNKEMVSFINDNFNKEMVALIIIIIKQ